MRVKLVALSGPWAGSTIPITGEQFSIGRAPTSDLLLPSRAVSRFHCVIKREGEDVKIVDLGSRQQTHVNGLAVQESVLHAGDRVAVADSEFVVSIDAGEGDLVAEVTFKDESLDPATLVERAPGDSIFMKTERVVQGASMDQRAVRGLEALLRIATAVNTIRSPETLTRRLIEMTLEALPARRGAVILVDEGSDEPRSIVTLDRKSERDAVGPISRTIVRYVLRTDNAVLSNNAPDDSAFGEALSIVDSGARAVLCVPVRAFGKPRGVVYLDSDEKEERFDDHDLQLLMAIGAIAAVALENARHIDWLENETRRLQVDLGLGTSMIGEGPRTREIARFVSKVAPTDTTVLIRGETGTGKELVARAIHANSARAAKPFVAVNCAALAETLLESELFGHEKGAFTGAVVQKRGRIESAEGGTLFLDEVGEIPSTLQAKLLRVLQEREYERVGSSRTLKANVRVIAATHRDLEKEVREERFRQDLYYRLNVVEITVPPLRERREDVGLLVDHFVARYSRQVGKRVVAVAPDARERLTRYDWPGNVRELQNVIERAVVLSDSEVLGCEDLPEALLELRASDEGELGRYQRAVNDLKRDLILTAVRESDGNLAAAARRLGLHPNYLHRLIRNMDLKGMLGR